MPVSGSVDDIIRDLQEAKAVIKIRKNLEANNALGQKYYGAYWHLNANPNDLKAIARWMSEFSALVREGTFSENTIDLMSKDLFDINPERDLSEYIDAGEEFVRVLTRLKDKLNPRSKLIFKRETGDVTFEAWQEQLYNWRGQLSSLHLWSQYLNTKNALQSSNARMFVESIEKRNIKKEDIEALVDGNFADSLLNILFVENQELATFIGELHENRIREFKDLDKKILVLNRKRIFHKLNSNIPKIFGGTENPQAKILAGEFTRKSGHMPVRKLLEKAGGMIKQIKPCFMMSPLSIAQYLDPTNEELQFDVVIFDEASQVKPEDALGAFMRGKTAVVMGDTQQLPPTSFFDQMSDADSNEEEATSLDMESILHLCKLSFPVKMLKWHYRSRHESLITVSNREFYDNDLLVYPSPSHSDPELGLKFHYNPNTAYDRGSSSANPLEAQDVVEEIFNHFEKYGDTKSLGVGTFSVAQKNAILEALEVKRKQYPQYEPLFSDNKEERFFVKNLETIQGDERDVILISVGYGFDNERKMSLNFGPLNQDGGERRLNVLITRAREKCVVFSNFKAYDMNLTANPPYGVKSLKEFLEYAENLTLGTPSVEAHTKEPFEDAIASFLEENGYTVDRQIGCAGFRVDLAIVDDENPGKYILGITTDGKMYSSSKVARDRDRLREQVLTGLGWKLYHLWSTDWYRNRDLGRKKLLDYVEKSIRKSREEEKRKSEEAKKLAEKRRLEAEKKAEELRLAREREEAEREAEEQPQEINPEDIGPSDFVEVEKVDDGDILEKPIDVGGMDPSELFGDDVQETSDIKDESEFVVVEESEDEPVDFDVKQESEFVVVEESEDEPVDFDVKQESEFVEAEEENIDDVYVENDSEFVADIPEESVSDDDSVSGDIDDEPPKDDIAQDDDAEVWEAANDDNVTQDDDAEVWEDIEDVPPQDNAEVWEDENDYAEDSEDEKSNPIRDRIKSFFHSEDSEEKMDKNPLFAGLKFTKDLGRNSDLEEDLDDPVKGTSKKSKTKDYSNKSSEDMDDGKVDLGSDDDYIYVDHSHDDERVLDEEEPIVFGRSVNQEVEEDSPQEGIDLSYDEADDSISEDETIEEPIKEADDSISEDETIEEPVKEADDSISKEEMKEPIKDEDGDEVDLGSDDDYVYVDHSNDESSSIDDEDVTDELDKASRVHVRNKHGVKDRINSFISDVINTDSQLEPEEIEIVRGEVIEKDEEPSYKPAPDDESVVEAEIVSGNEELNIFTDELPDLNNDVSMDDESGEKIEMDDLERPTPKHDFEQEDDELNIFTDKELKFDSEIRREATRVVDDAVSQFMDEVFDNINLEEELPKENVEDIEEIIEDNEIDKKAAQDAIEDNEIDEKAAQDEIEDDGLTYYKGANDVKSKLRKNNFYYEDEKPRSVRDSIKGFKKDMQYINKSLKEIENPTQIDYVSVVDRTEEYNPEDYLNMPSDDDSDLIIQKEEGLTFAEQEEKRIEEELMMEALEKEIASDENVIVTVHEQHRREELKDQALEDIISSANEDYKEIEKERYQSNNTLKSFDDQKLPGKRKLEDSIVDYVQADDIGLHSQDDLYKKPASEVAKSITYIVDVEVPIHVNEVIKRVKDSCEIKRAGSNLKKAVNAAIGEAEKSGDIIRIGDFLYDASDNNVLIRKRNKPNIDLISDEEISKNIELVLLHKQNLTTKQIAKETSRNFGFKSTSKKTADRINGVLDLMIANNKVKISNDVVQLN